MTRGSILRTVAGAAGCAALLSVLVLGCINSNTQSAKDADWPDKPGPKVVVSFAPLYCFAANVAGDDAVVKNVMTTTGPHDFEPSADDARLVGKADILFTVGLGLDDLAADRMKKGANNDKLKVVALSSAIPKDKLLEGHCDHAHHGADHKHDSDPHVWLSPDLAILMVYKIRDELSALDPAHAGGYATRAEQYVTKLTALKTFGAAQFKKKTDNRLVSFHDSLTYFAHTFDLEIRGVLTQQPGKEPDAAQMKKLIRICIDETKPTRVIAVEPQYSNSGSGEALRKELLAKGVKNPVLAEIDTLETVQPDALEPDWYEKRMRENIRTLLAALE